MESREPTAPLSEGGGREPVSQARGLGFHRSTPPGAAAIALFEVFGDEAPRALARLFRARAGSLPAPGEARFGEVADTSGNAIDEAVLAHVPEGASWSRLESWALSVHGGPWIQTAVARALEALGARELSRREVLARAVALGRLDGPAAAAYELLVEARTPRAAKFFLRQYSGEFSRRVREAVSLTGRGDAEGAGRIVRELLEGSARALRLSEPLRILLAGRPNAGKSTLFNLLAGEERTAVAPVPGTTRDAIEAVTAIEGYPVELTDSAGIRPLEGLDAIEREGVRRALARPYDAVLYLIPHPWVRDASDREFLERAPPERRLVLATFADLAQRGERPEADLRVSAVSGEGIADLRRTIVLRWLDGREGPPEDVPCAAFDRRLVERLERASRHLERAGARDLDAAREALVESLAWGMSGIDGGP